MRREDRTSISSHPLADLGRQVVLIRLRHRGLLIFRCSFRVGRSSSLGGCVSIRPRFEVPAMSQNTPSDAGQLVGRLDPGLEPVALPALWLDQHDPCRLHEQNPQVAIAALGYLAKDGAVSGRGLLGIKAE